MPDMFFYDNDFLEKHNSFIIEHNAIKYNTELYDSPYMMLVYAAHGNGIYRNKNNIDILEGQVLLINNAKSHGFSSQGNGKVVDFYTCTFLPSFLPVNIVELATVFPKLQSFLNGKTSYFMIDDSMHRDIRNMFVHMIDDREKARPAYKLSIQSILMTIIIDMMRIYCADKNNSKLFNSNIIMGEIDNFVQKNFYRKITLDELSDKYHLSAPYICRLVKKHSGITLTEYINKRRVQIIKDELEHTDRPLYVIYDDFEFSSQYLNRLFKSYTGFSLADYKKKYNYKVGNPLF